LRGNVVGWQEASSRNKFLRFIVGRHDLPFYYPSAVQMQKSFLDAFLKDEDRDGWSTGNVPRVGMLIRKGDGGVDDPLRETTMFKERFEKDWPLPDTEYRKIFLTGDLTLSERDQGDGKCFSYDAMAG
jgi:predicted acyl esterase